VRICTACVDTEPLQAHGWEGGVYLQFGEFFFFFLEALLQLAATYVQFFPRSRGADWRRSLNRSVCVCFEWKRRAVSGVTLKLDCRVKEVQLALDSTTKRLVFISARTVLMFFFTG